MTEDEIRKHARDTEAYLNEYMALSEKNVAGMSAENRSLLAEEVAVAYAKWLRSASLKQKAQEKYSMGG